MGAGMLLILTTAILLWVAACANPQMQPSADWELVRVVATEVAQGRLAAFDAEHQARLATYGTGKLVQDYLASMEQRRRAAARARWEGLFRDRDLVAQEQEQRLELLDAMLPARDKVLSKGEVN